MRTLHFGLRVTDLDRVLGQRAGGDRTYGLAFTRPVPSDACRTLLPQRVQAGTVDPRLVTSAGHAACGPGTALLSLRPARRA